MESKSLFRIMSQVFGHALMMLYMFRKKITKYIPTHVNCITYINTEHNVVLNIYESSTINIIVSAILQLLHVPRHNFLYKYLNYDPFSVLCFDNDIDGNSNAGTDASTNYASTNDFHDFYAFEIWSQETRKYEYVMIEKQLLHHTIKDRTYPIDDLLGLLENNDNTIFSIQVNGRLVHSNIDNYIKSLNIHNNVTAECINLYDYYLTNESTFGYRGSKELIVTDYDLVTQVFKGSDFIMPMIQLNKD